MNAVPLIPDTTALQEASLTFRSETYQTGETVLPAGSRTGRLLFLRDGAVALSSRVSRLPRRRNRDGFGEVSPLLIGRTQQTW